MNVKHSLTFLRAFLALATLVLLCACGTAQPSATEADATVTPLPAALVQPTLVPTSTPAPTQVVIAALPQVTEAQQRLAENKFERAVSLLRATYAEHPDSSEARSLLAGAYLAWGRSIVNSSDGNPSQIRQALDHFTLGLSVAPEEGEERENLRVEEELARGFLGAAELLRELEQAQPVELARAIQVVDLLDQVRKQRSDYPGSTPQHVKSLTLAGTASAATVKKGSEKEQIDVLNQALAYCNRALELSNTDSAAQACQSAVQSRIKLTIATPTPTAAPKRLRISRVNQNDSSDCISMQIRGISASGWTFSVDGIRGVAGVFDGGGNARICGLPPGQNVTFTVKNAQGGVVPGGSAPARGGDIFEAEWR